MSLSFIQIHSVAGRLHESVHSTAVDPSKATMLPLLVAAATANAIHPDLEFIRFGDNVR